MTAVPIREQWQIRHDPISALADWPDLAAEFDARWQGGAYSAATDKTVGDQFASADALAVEILTAAGALKPRGAA